MKLRTKKGKNPDRRLIAWEESMFRGSMGLSSRYYHGQRAGRKIEDQRGSRHPSRGSLWPALEKVCQW